MKKIASVLVGLLVCVLVIAACYFWAYNLMGSIFAYRSPLHDSPPLPGEALGSPVTSSVVMVLIDGLRYDTSLNPSVMPFLSQMRAGGASAEMHSQPPSLSQPGYSVLLTGAWPELNDGPVMNLDYADIPTLTQDNIFSDASRAGLKTAFSGFDWFQKLVPQQAISSAFYTAGEDQPADQDVVNAALPWLQGGQYQLVLIHLDQVDYAGHHEGGPADPRWDQAAERVDALLQEIGTTMDLTRQTLLVVSDHGHIDQGGHGGQDAITMTEPFVLVGKGVMPGKYGDVQMVDVAPTISILLGTSIPATSQGHPQVAMLDLTLDQVDQIKSALSAQQAQLALYYQTAIGKPVAVQQTSDIVTSTQTAIEATRNSLLDNQRLPRGIAAIFLTLMFIYLAAWHSKPYFGTMLLGVIGYLVVFNIKYLLIDDMMYSISTAVDATSFVGSTALSVLLALLVGWLMVMIGTKVYQLRPRKAADLTMKFVLTLIAILFIPIFVHFAINGAIVTWTLPNFMLSYLGLIFLMQAFMVAAIGIVFTGLAALLGMFSRQR